MNRNNFASHSRNISLRFAKKGQRQQQQAERCLFSFVNIDLRCLTFSPFFRVFTGNFGRRFAVACRADEHPNIFVDVSIINVAVVNCSSEDKPSYLNFLLVQKFLFVLVLVFLLQVRGRPRKWNSSEGPIKIIS